MEKDQKLLVSVMREWLITKIVKLILYMAKLNINKEIRKIVI